MFFDKSTVKPIIGSESAVPAAGYAPRRELKELPFFNSALSVRMPESVEPSFDENRLRAGSTIKIEGFDPGSERTLAAWLRHASRTIRYLFVYKLCRIVAKG